MKQPINITVSGACASGKTTIIKLLLNELLQIGFDATVITDELAFSTKNKMLNPLAEYPKNDILNQVVKKSEVFINECITNINPNNNVDVSIGDMLVCVANNESVEVIGIRKDQFEVILNDTSIWLPKSYFKK